MTVDRGFWQAHEGAVFALACGRLAGREVLVSAGRDGKVMRWDLAGSDRRGVLIGAHNEPAIGIATGHADGHDIAASTSVDGTVCVWNLAGDAQRSNHAPLLKLEGHRGSVVSVAIADIASGHVIVSSGDDRTVRVWDAVSGDPLDSPMVGHIGPVSAVAIGKAGPADVIVSGGHDGFVRVWNATTRQAIGQALTGHVDAVRAVAIGGEPEREVIVSGGTDGTVRVWDAISREPLGEPLQGQARSVFAVALARVDDRVVIIAAGIHGSLQAWNAMTRGPCTAPHGRHDASVWALAVGTAEDDPVVVSGAEDGTLRIWNLREDTSRDRVPWALDTPTKDDKLGRDALAHALALRLDRLRAQTAVTSFLVHIDGRWGSGKSTLLELLRKELLREQPPPEDPPREDPPPVNPPEPWLIVTYDAWRQKRVGPPWWALLTALRRTLSEDRRVPSRLWLRIAEAWHRAPQLHVLVGCTLLVAVAAGLAGLSPRIDIATADELVASLTVLAAGLGVLYGAGAAISRFVLWESAAGAQRFEQSHRDPMESLAEHFSWLIARARKPVVFFIDDLDRCDSQHVVELLDSIQTLLRVSSPGRHSAPYFVVAADGRWIRDSYEQAHASCGGAVGEPGRPLGYLFLDKIFQVTVDVPSMTTQRQGSYLDSLLGTQRADTTMSTTQPDDPDNNDELAERLLHASETEILEVLAGASPDQRPGLTGLALDGLDTDEVQRSTEHVLRTFAPLLEPNPRAMKRFINAYWIARALLLVDESYLSRDQLALCTILRGRYPALADCLREHPEAIAPFVAGRAATTDVPEHLAPLFGDPNVMRIVRHSAVGPLRADTLHAYWGHSQSQRPDDDDVGGPRPR